ncbi:hypothetical protein D3C78_1010400 [compost metagenome]
MHGQPVEPRIVEHHSGLEGSLTAAESGCAAQMVGVAIEAGFFGEVGVRPALLNHTEGAPLSGLVIEVAVGLFAAMQGGQHEMGLSLGGIRRLLQRGHQ